MNFSCFIRSTGHYNVYLFVYSFPRMLDKICKDSQMLVDFYINYDCDPEAPNLFERLVWCIAFHFDSSYCGAGSFGHVVCTLFSILGSSRTDNILV